jgi:3-hydroxyisobutyrate dehydrogenase
MILICLGVTGAKAGTLSFLCGGTEAAYAEALPYLKDMGAKFFYCGPSGDGLGAKIMNNLILGVHQIVVGEAMLLGHHKLGLDPAVLANVINSSTGACWASSVNNPVPSALKEKSPPCERDYEGGFATALMLKVRYYDLHRGYVYGLFINGHYLLGYGSSYSTRPFSWVPVTDE